jgi:glycosyltransferase involved in cell wall biosynthesis
MKIAVSCLSNISTDATSVRAQRVFELLQKKYDCTLIIRGEQHSKFENVTVIKPSKLWNFQLIPVFLKNRFDLVFCVSDFWGFFTYFILARLFTFKIVFEAHGILSLEKELRLRDPSPIDKVRMETIKWREKFAIKHADWVIALCSDICDYYGRFNKRISLVPNFVDEIKFKPRKVRAEWKSDDGEGKTIGLIGPFFHNDIRGSALDIVYTNIDEFNDDLKFVVIGKCDYEIQNERIRYTGYLNDFQDYVDTLTRLDAVLAATRFPTSGPPTKILEAMACSVPVFTTPGGAVGLDYITAGEDILIYDESEMVAKINELLFKIDFLERVGKNARRTFEVYYSTAANESKLFKVIDWVCSP